MRTGAHQVVIRRLNNPLDLAEAFALGPNVDHNQRIFARGRVRSPGPHVKKFAAGSGGHRGVPLLGEQRTAAAHHLGYSGGGAAGCGVGQGKVGGAGEREKVRGGKRQAPGGG